MTRNKDRDAERKMRVARARLGYLRPYFAHAIYAAVLVEAPNCPSFSIDRYKRLYYNPLAVRALSVDQLSTMQLHEIGHPLRDHPERARSMGITRVTHHIANICMDAELNDDTRDEANERGDIAPLADPIWDDEIMKLPEKERGPFYPWKLDCEDYKTWEVYYAHCMDNATINGVPLHDCGSGAHGISRPWEVGDPASSGVEGVMDADWRDVQRITARSIAEHHKRRGNVPAGWVEWADAMLRPQRVPWDQVLAGTLRWALHDVSGHRYHSYKRPSRRASILDGVCLPQMRSPKPFVCIVGDTSMSMDVAHDLALVRGVVEDVCQAMGAMVAFLATDAEVHGGTQMVHGGRGVELRGRGGTNMSAGIEYALTKLKPRPDVIVVCTDCETGWPEKRPPIKTVICAIGASDDSIDKCPDWATVIPVEAT